MQSASQISVCTEKMFFCPRTVYDHLLCFFRMVCVCVWVCLCVCLWELLRVRVFVWALPIYRSFQRGYKCRPIHYFVTEEHSEASEWTPFGRLFVHRGSSECISRTRGHRVAMLNELFSFRRILKIGGIYFKFEVLLSRKLRGVE